MNKECNICGETYDDDANETCPYCEEDDEGLDGDDDGSLIDYRSL
jgi:RNA polymerase subunit RPABC4/transcription elongation factor Spt4